MARTWAVPDLFFVRPKNISEKSTFQQNFCSRCRFVHATSKRFRSRRPSVRCLPRNKYICLQTLVYKPLWVFWHFENESKILHESVLFSFSHVPIYRKSLFMSKRSNLWCTKFDICSINLGIFYIFIQREALFEAAGCLFGYFCHSEC